MKALLEWISGKSQQLTQATDIQEEEIWMSINLSHVEGIVKNYDIYSDHNKINFLHWKHFA